MSGARTRSQLLLLGLLVAAPFAAAAQQVSEASPSESVERHLPSDQPFMHWVEDPELLATESGDRLEQREVLADDREIVKLTNVVPPIRFESGVADIPPSYVQRLRGILDSMRHLRNVRLHLVGHADDQPLSGDLAGIFGDNAGLSRERAGEVAEFLQTQLSLPPESISFEWAGDRQPIASNATEAGRAQNRRVEVEVWYDEIGKKVELEDVVVSEEIKRIKVCRMETVCKLRYREGHAFRARVKNLVPPLRFDDETVGLPADFVRQIREGLHNLRDKRNVTVKFIGFTDDEPLTGRADRIYGTHLALSKARAHRVALAIREALDLPTYAIDSDGRGATRPIASNETQRGQAANRRIEVEFWHDDPLQELPEEPQLCPDAASAEVVTKVYDPPWGRIPAVVIEGGEPVIAPGYTGELARAMADLDGKASVRLRFVGYTANEPLDRRTAAVYGDDIGLSAARARRTMESVKGELGLEDAQAEHEGRGYVHSGDVVNAGFIQGDTSHVAVQVVYDELAVLDDYEGVDVTPITRELSARHPLELNLMRITVDGKPVDDPGRSSSDIQRCTDVALERADIQFQFDNLEAEPRLSVTSDPSTVPEPGESPAGAETVLFRTWSNYGHFIEQSEVRLFERGQSREAEPLAVLEVDRYGFAEWQPEREWFTRPVRELQYVLRAYDAEGRFDETRPQALWLVHGEAAVPGPRAGGAGFDPRDAAPDPGGQGALDPLLAGYGENGLALRNIPLGSAGTVRVRGSGIPGGHRVRFAGDAVPVAENGEFVAEAILPSGMHTVEVAVLDQEGRGELFLRDLEFRESDWFAVGVADLTLSMNSSSGPIDELEGDNALYDDDSYADGRLAFFVDGKFGESWRLTASADTREGPVEDLFSNFLDKSPEALFRRIDPEDHYPTFGDDSTVEESAPTSGKFYVKLERGENHAMWGNFKVGYLENELAHVDRGLYGANLHYQSLGTTGFGEQRLALDGFAADPGTVPSREEFRGTGGSLYFLRRQDLLVGSERVRIEVRDKDSGLVSGVVHLRPALDYDIDYLQGRVLLTEPLSSFADDGLLVRSGGLSGDAAFLVVQYEYTPGFDELDTLATGGQSHFWVNDFVKLGMTANRNEEEGTDSSLYAGDLTLRRSADSWFKLQAGRSEGLVSSSFRSEDGGFNFLDPQPTGLVDADALAYRADLSIGFGDLFDGMGGRISLYGQMLGAGYSAPGLTALSDTQQFGGSLGIPLTERLRLDAKADRGAAEDGLETISGELDLDYQLTERWNLAAGARHELREDESPVVPVTQQEGERTDALLQVGYDSLDRWRVYGFGQGTVLATKSRDDNHRGGIGGSYRLSDRLLFDGEVSHGNLGPAAKIGTSYQQTEQTRYYLNYSLESERTDNALRGGGGSLVTGARSRLSDSASVYLENRYQHASTSGLTNAVGISLAPFDRWNLGANWETGTLVDRETSAEIERHAGGASIGYAFDKMQFSSGFEYRFDESENADGTSSDRTTWLLRNSLKVQLVPDWRLLGTFNHSFSDSSLGEFFDGGYTKGVLGFAYRPVGHDRLNALAKYTYFYDVPTTDQVSVLDTSSEFVQKSHVASLDLMYDLTANLAFGGKYAYRLGQVSLDREDPEFFDNSAHLYVLRSDWRFLANWEASAEGRMLDLLDLDERRSGAMVTLYRYLGDHMKVGVGYNFTDFSDDLTDLSYDHHGWFLNLVGTL